MTEDQKQPQNNSREPWWRRRKKQPAKHSPVEAGHDQQARAHTEQARHPQQRPHRSRHNRQKPPEKPRGNYAFIDSQNLNLGVQKAGWKMDWHKFREWLRTEYNVTQAFMFIGYMAENEDLYKQMYEHGFLVVLKPTNEIMIVEKPEDKGREDKEKLPVKGNIDADLVLYAMKELPNYDKAIIVSNDGDFFGLVEYLAEQKKLLKVMTPNHKYSMLLRPFEPYLFNLDKARGQLHYRTFRRPRK